MKFKPDYIIVGAGSAGCILANRLSADPSVNVLLIEAGGKDGSLFYRMPAGFFELMKTGKGNWNYETVAQTELNGRKIYFPRGKVLGGSSSINGLVASRGNSFDYDHWAELGNLGWSYDECLPYFKRLENFALGDPSTRGHDGPIGVTLSPLETMNPTSRAWIDGGMQAGHPFNVDVNSGNSLGVAQVQGSYANGVRQSTSSQYLTPVLHRSNLQVLTGALVKKLVISAGCVIGVEYIQRGHVHICNANREVLLSGGAINSPQILQLSGIGNSADIRAHGIAVKHELKGVGRNLIDHLSIALKQRITKPYSMLGDLHPLSMVKALGQYLLFKSGPTTVSALEAWAHLKSKDEITHPDLQIYAVPLMYNDHGRDVIKEEGVMAVLNGIQPKSVGTVKICSSDPTVAPAIDPKYLSDPDDLRVMRAGIRLSREIFAQKAYDEFRGSEYAPGATATSDADLDNYIRSESYTLYHPVGTCKMGHDDMAVVDNQLKVHGIEGLRVIDASVMPSITSGNTNFPTMMIAEKAADLILESNQQLFLQSSCKI
jgi:choline dehydrogenase